MNKPIESVSAIYDNIERLCVEKGKQVGTMCAEAGISTGVLSDLKSGRTKYLSTRTVFKIAETLEVSTDEILNTKK